MKVRAKTIARVVRQAQDGSCFDNLAFPDQGLLKVCVNSLISIPVQNTHVNTVIMTGWLTIDLKYFPWGYAINFAAGRGPDVQAIMTRQAKLSIISWIRPKVLRNYAELCRPDFKFEIPHIGYQLDCRNYFKIMSSSLSHFWTPDKCTQVIFASPVSRSRI